MRKLRAFLLYGLPDDYFKFRDSAIAGSVQLVSLRGNLNGMEVSGVDLELLKKFFREKSIKKLSIWYERRIASKITIEMVMEDGLEKSLTIHIVKGKALIFEQS